MNRTIGRRSVLRGAGLALPALEIMGTRARAAAAPVRFVGFSLENGVHPAIWRPARVGHDYTLTPGLLPLEPVRAEVNVLSGLHQRWVGGGGHGPGLHAGLTGHPAWLIAKETNVGRQPSLDQVIGQKAGAGVRFPSLVVSPGVHGYSRSWLGPNRPTPVVQGPRALFELLFPGPEVQATAAARAARSLRLVDFVREDARALRARLGARDRGRLDEHLTALDELEVELRTPAQLPAGCGPPAFDALAGSTPESRALTLRIVSLALACDLTRSVLVVFGYVGQATKNGKTYGDHDASHTQELDVIASITREKTQLMATLVQLLKGIPEGEGTLLRNTVALTFWDVADGNKHDSTDLPILQAGGGGGRIRTGAHLRYADLSVNRLYASVLGYVGAPGRFGIDESEPLPGLEG